MEHRHSSHYPNIGVLGEDLIAHWWQTQGGKILARRWRCQAGEIDLIVQYPGVGEKKRPTVAFVEVKTRQRRNWDQDGLLAITAQKQARICQAAAMFLSQQPEIAEFPCQFDVALVRYHKALPVPHLPQFNYPLVADDPPIQLGQPLFMAGYQLVLQEYLSGAFVG